MQETITPILIDSAGKYPKVYITAKKYYGASKEIAEKLVPMQSYQVELEGRTVPLAGGKSFTAFDIIEALPTTKVITKPVETQRSASPVDNNKAIRENMDVKNLNISRCCVLNNSVLELQAIMNAGSLNGAFDGMSKEDLKVYAQSLRKTIQQENALTLEVDMGISF